MVKKIIDRKLAIGTIPLAVANLLALVQTAIGVSLLIGGLFLLLADAALLVKPYEIGPTVQALSYLVDAFPGVPVPMEDLVGYGITAVGIVVWIVGFNLLLIGLGLWIRHKLAIDVALVIFLLAAYFDFVEFLFSGVLGAPASVVGVSLNGLIVYALLKARG